MQCATNGIRFAQDPAFARAAKEAGLRIAYLQFDGVGEEANAHRKVGNLFDVKLRAIENLHAAGIDVVLVVTVVRGVNDDQVGPDRRFAIENADKVTVVSFQPVSFTGRDEDIGDEERDAKRYTLSHLAHDLHEQIGRDRAAARLVPALGDGAVRRPDRPHARRSAPSGARSSAAATRTAASAPRSSSTRRREQMVPLAQVLDLEGLLADIQEITDAAQPRAVTLAELARRALPPVRRDATRPPASGWRRSSASS